MFLFVKNVYMAIFLMPLNIKRKSEKWAIKYNGKLIDISLFVTSLYVKKAILLNGMSFFDVLNH